MKLKRINYSQYEGKPHEWAVRDLGLGDLNLIVGKNATGKTKILNVINNFAKVIAGKIKSPMTGNFDLGFEHEGKAINYVLRSEESRVLEERFSEGGHEYLSRGSDGIGKIYAQKLGEPIDFQTPETELAAVARRDKMQHSYFEPLHEWARNLRSYSFGTQFGKDKLSVAVKGKPMPLPDDDPDAVVPIFIEAQRQYQQSFKNAVIADMAEVGYEIDFIGVKEPISLTVQTSIGDPVGLYVKERSLRAETDQFDMSQGMFRTLSILIHLNYAQKARMPSCILIDDIGEGLDFERSCALIELLMRKARTQQVQLIMTTNDRFVMNKVPLEAWTLIQRLENGCCGYNYDNSKESFDNFKFTGLNNFDFFASDFISGGSDLLAVHDE